MAKLRELSQKCLFALAHDTKKYLLKPPGLEIATTASIYRDTDIEIFVGFCFLAASYIFHTSPNVRLGSETAIRTTFIFFLIIDELFVLPRLDFLNYTNLNNLDW